MADAWRFYKSFLNGQDSSRVEWERDHGPVRRGQNKVAGASG